MKIVSLVNSGESFDKAVALIDCAFKSDADFYKSFEQVLVFYCNDLTKKKGQRASGSVAAFLDMQKQYCKEHKITREYIINLLHKKEFVTLRGAVRLQRDEQRYSKFIENIPWYLIFDEEKNRILDFMKNKYPNVEFINIGDAFSAERISSVLPYYQRIGKLYLLLRDGNVKAFRIGKKDIEVPKILKCEAQGIVAGGNVYSFIMLITDYASKVIGADFCIGYRPASRFKRKAYDSAIEYVSCHYFTKVEPKNVVYNKYYTLIGNIQNDDLNYRVICAAFLDAVKELYEC